MTDKQPIYPDCLTNPTRGLRQAQTGYVLVPVEPEQKYLRPFHSCPPDELELAWSAMVTVARVAAPKAPQQAAPAVLHDIDAGVEVMAWLRESGAPHSIYSKMSACLFGDPDKKAAATEAAPKQEVQEPWGACVEGRVFVGNLPEHVRKLAEEHGWAIRWLYTAQPAPSGDAEDTAMLDWLDQNIFHREMSEWDAKYGGRGDQNMWVLFAPKGVQGTARNIINAARKDGTTNV